MCLEFADKILIFAVLERQLLQLRETDSSFVLLARQASGGRLMLCRCYFLSSSFFFLTIAWNKDIS